MTKNIQYIPEDERNIDWDEVEYKISILCRKFSNLSSRYIDDLAQELRIHAYYVSDDYYDLHRKAIDFWRSVTRRIYPEIPFLDLESMITHDVTDEVTSKYYCEEVVSKIKNELDRGPHQNVRAKELDTIASRVLDIILEDLDVEGSNETSIDVGLSKYHNGRISLSYLDRRLPEVHYKRLVKAVKRLEEVVTGLKEMGSI